MINRLAFHPDLTQCELEDRTLLSYSPYIPGFALTTFGYVVITTPPGLNSSLNTIGALINGGASTGGNIPAAFFINGFGTSSFAIGNTIGALNLNALSGGSNSTGPIGVGAPVGSGADVSGASANSGTSSMGATGGIVSSGYNTSLNASNNYGMSTSPVGSVPVHSYTGGGDMTPDTTEAGMTPNPAANQAAPANTTPPPTNNPTSSMSPAGILNAPWNKLLGRNPGTSSGLLNGPGNSNNP